MPLVYHRCRQCSYWWRKRANKIRYSAHRWRHRKRHRHGAEELSYYIWHRPTPKQTHDFVFKVIITNKRCDGLSTDLPNKYHLTPICSWLRTKLSMMWFLQPMIIKVSMSRPCGEQTVVAILICKLSQHRLLLSQIMHEQSCSSIFVSLLISIDQMSFVTPHRLLLPHCLEPCTGGKDNKCINESAIHR